MRVERNLFKKEADENIRGPEEICLKRKQMKTFADRRKSVRKMEQIKNRCRLHLYVGVDGDRKCDYRKDSGYSERLVIK